MKTFYCIVVLAITLFACRSTKPEKVLFSDFINTSEIDSVFIINNSGGHFIQESELAEFKIKLGSAALDNSSYKLGSITCKLYMLEDVITFYSSTNSNHLEIHSDYFQKNLTWVDDGWMYFELENMNFNNY